MSPLALQERGRGRGSSGAQRSLCEKAGRTSVRRKLKFALLSWWTIPGWSANFSLRFLFVPEGQRAGETSPLRTLFDNSQIHQKNFSTGRAPPVPQGKRIKSVKKANVLQCPRRRNHTKPDIDIAVISYIPVANGTAHVPRIRVPRTTTQHICLSIM